MAQKISSLPVGAKVKDKLTKYNGQPIVWKIADKNHTGYPSNTVTLISDKILSIKPTDAKEPRNADSNRQNYGNNNYKNSNILQWLNSNSSNWYNPKHGADEAPVADKVSYNPYDREPGFMYGFSSDFIKSIIETDLKTVRHSLDSGSSEIVRSKIFLASTTEVGLANENGISEGYKLALFDGDESRKAYPTQEAVSKSNYTTSNLNINSPWYWWLRTPYTSYSFYVGGVHTDGSLNWDNAYYGRIGVRPLCNLNSEILVSNTQDSDGSYTIEWNQPPTSPGTINAPSKIQAGKQIEITWGQATDPEGNSIGYVLERKIDNGSYYQVYKGIARSFTDRIEKGKNTVTYRVKAYDSNGAYSNYVTSPTRDVNNNQDPVITSSTGENLGTKTGAFTVSYTVSDPDAGQSLKVKEFLDGVQKRSYNASNNVQYSFSISNVDWQEILNGSHKIKIEVTDSEGATAEKVFSFSKNESEIKLELKEPLAADAMVTKALLTMLAQLPTEATVKIEICNNAFDSKPTWEDVTNKVKQGQKIFLTNKSKTASKWGVNIRVSIARNGASGECYISSIGGNFE